MITANTQSISPKQNSVGVPPTSPKAHQKAVGANQTLSIEGIKAVAEQYGYGLTSENELISTSGKILSTSIQIKGSRLQVLGMGQLLFSGNTPRAIGAFLERFYFAKKTNALSGDPVTAEVKRQIETGTSADIAALFEDLSDTEIASEIGNSWPDGLPTTNMEIQAAVAIYRRALLH